MLLEFCAVQINLSWCGYACREAAEDDSGAPAAEKLLQDEAGERTHGKTSEPAASF